MELRCFSMSSPLCLLYQGRIKSMLEFPLWRQLSDDCPRKPYKPSTKATFDGTAPDAIKGLHYGQRKLLLSEIEFLTAVVNRWHVNRADTGNIVVVYAGAANGSHLPFLFTLFPMLRFVLIDPAPFCSDVQSIAENSDGPIAELIQGYCTDELCLRIRRDHAPQEGETTMILISDIRSGVPSKSTNREHTAMILRDNEWQREWCWSLGASAAMLKFHPPYPRITDQSNPKYDEGDTTPESIEYLEGRMLLGVWAPKSSSEVRLVVEGPFTKDYKAPMRSYHCTEFEERCYYYNTNNRYQSDVKAERAVLETYLTAPWKALEVESAAQFSSRVSAELGYPIFLPLQEGFTEEHARLVTLLYLSRNSGDVALFDELKDRVTSKWLLEQLARRLNDGTEGVTDGVVTQSFWSRIANSKALGEAYSFPPLPMKHHPNRSGRAEFKHAGVKRERDV